MPVDIGTLRELMMPGLREVVFSQLDIPAMWRRLFDFIEIEMGPERRAPANMVENIEQPLANRGEDDGLVFPREWKSPNDCL